MEQRNHGVSRRHLLRQAAGAAAGAGWSFYVITRSRPARAGEASAFRVGALGPLTDFTGRDILRAAQMAAEEINQAGGVLGRPLEIVPADEGDPEQTVRAFQQLVTRDRVHAVVGGFRSGVILAVLPHVARARIPFIITGAASPDITKDVRRNYRSFKYIFRAWVNSNRQAVNLAGVVKEILNGQAGFTRFAIDAENLKWARDYVDILKPLLVQSGFDVVYETFHDPAITDFSPIFEAASRARAQVLLEIISNQAGYTIVKQWKAQRPRFALAGNNNPSYLVSSFWRDTEGACEYELSAYVKAPLSSKSLDFWARFEARHKESPFYTGTGAYDAVYLLKLAAERAGSFGADELVEALEQSDYEGVIGRIRFDEDHEATIPLPYGQWIKGNKVAIWPERFSLGRYQVPPWL